MRFWFKRAAAAAAAALVAAAVPAASGAAEFGAARTVSRYGDLLGAENRALSVPQRRELAERVLLLSSYYRLDPRLLIALVSVESAWRSHAVSRVGARGLGQLMPGTAATLQVDAFETYENLDGTARYLRRLLMRFPNYAQPVQYRFALAAYNAGPGAVARYHGVPPYAETQSYVTRVMNLWQRFCGAAPGAPVRAWLANGTPSRTRGGIDVIDVPLTGPHPALVLARIPRFSAGALGAASIGAAAPARRGIFGFLHRRREEPVALPAPEPGVDAIADQRAYAPRGNRP